MCTYCVIMLCDGSDERFVYKGDDRGPSTLVGVKLFQLTGVNLLIASCETIKGCVSVFRNLI